MSREFRWRHTGLVQGVTNSDKVVVNFEQEEY